MAYNAHGGPIAPLHATPPIAPPLPISSPAAPSMPFVRRHGEPDFIERPICDANGDIFLQHSDMSWEELELEKRMGGYVTISSLTHES